MLLPALVVPLTVAQVPAVPAPCIARVNEVKILPSAFAKPTVWRDPGQGFVVQVWVENLAGAPPAPAPGVPPPPASKVDVHYKIGYDGPPGDAAPDHVTTVTFTTSHQNATFPLEAIPLDAAKGRANVTVTLTPNASNGCTVPDAAYWGFWNGVRSDLSISGFERMKRSLGGQDFEPIDDKPDQPNWNKMRLTRHTSTTTQQDAMACFYEDTDRPGKVYFKLDIDNDGTANFSRPTDEGGTLPLKVRMAVNGTVVATETLDVRVNNTADVLAEQLDKPLFPVAYDLLNNMSLRNITFTVDPSNLPGGAGEVPELDETNNVYSSNDSTSTVIDIKAPDLAGSITNVLIDQVLKSVKGNFSLSNIGPEIAGVSPFGMDPNDADNLCRSRTGKGFRAALYLDTVDADGLLVHATQKPNEVEEEITLGPGQALGPFDFSAKNLSAGVHNLILVLDGGNRSGDGIINDHNRANNRVTSEVGLEDLATPELTEVRVVPPTGAKAGQDINISGTVADDADFTLAPNDVLVDMTLPGNGTQTFSVRALEGQGRAGFKANTTANVAEGVVASDFWVNQSYEKPGDYAFTVRAVDSAGHTNASASVAFHLDEYTKDLDWLKLYVCSDRTKTGTGPATDDVNGKTRCDFGHTNWTSPTSTPTNIPDVNTLVGNTLNLTFRVLPGATGLDEESRNASRKFVRFTDPDDKVILVPLTMYTVDPVCFNNVTDTETPCNNLSELDCAGGDGEGGADSTNCYNHTFRMRTGLGEGTPAVLGLADPPCPQPAPVWGQNLTFTEPGPYNVTVFIGDRGDPCRFKTHGLPNEPLHKFELWLAPTTTIENVTLADLAAGSLDAGRKAVFTADLTAAHKLKQAVVQVYRGDTLVVEQNMTRVGGSAASGNGTYRLELPTGIRTALDLAGSYQYLIGVKDANHTWGFSTGDDGDVCYPDIKGCTPEKIGFRLRDTGPPRVTGVTPAFADPLDPTPATSFQKGTPIVFQGEVDDDTRITKVEAVVQDTSRRELFRVDLSLVANTTTLWRSATEATGDGTRLPEGSYRLLVQATDSGGNVGSSEVTFLIAANLAPAALAPFPRDRGFATPQAEVRVELRDDLQGVNVSSVAVEVTVGVAPAKAPAGLVTEEVRIVNASGVEIVSRVKLAFPLARQGAQHGDLIGVKVTSSDGSTPPLTGSFNWTFTVDGVAPKSLLTCAPSYPDKCGVPGTQAVRRDTRFNLTSDDTDPLGKASSGVAGVGLSLSRSEKVLVTETHATPVVDFTLDDLAARHGLAAFEEGVYALTHLAVDNAGNTEPVGPAQSLLLDTSGPSIRNVARTPLAAGWNVTATITDTGSDVASARLFHRTGPTAFQNVSMAQLPGSTFWTAILPGTARGREVCFYLEAQDHLGSTGSSGTASAPVCFTAENHPPELTIQRPREGEEVGPSMTVQWQVQDIDGDPITVSLGYRRQGDLLSVPVPLSSEDQGRRAKAVDVSQLGAGTYTVQLEASDDQPFNNRVVRQVNVTVGGTTTGGGPTFDKDHIAPGELVTVRITLPRPAREVEAILLRDGREVDRQPMEEDPPGSLSYVATFRVTEPGTYEVQVVGVFQDGTPFGPLRGASRLTVGPTGIALDQVVLLALGAGVIAVAALALARRRGG